MAAQDPMKRRKSFSAVATVILDAGFPAHGPKLKLEATEPGTPQQLQYASEAVPYSPRWCVCRSTRPPPPPASPPRSPRPPAHARMACARQLLPGARESHSLSRSWNGEASAGYARFKRSGGARL